ncbi:MAG: substrate-binding domain-containing protein [Chthoniobacterales bacterium]
MRKRPCIYIVLDPDGRFTRLVYQGIIDYFSENGRNFELALTFGEPFIHPRKTLKGIIFLATKLSLIRTVRSHGVPVVNMSSALKPLGLPSAISDNETGGRMAAEHLLKCRFHNFGCYGSIKGNQHVLRRVGFKKGILEAGFKCAMHLDSMKNFDEMINLVQQKNLQRWIAHLPKPVGIFCVSDRDAYQVYNACEALDIEIGKEVGIVGYGNDEFFCKTRHPGITSIEPRPERIGYEAAALMVRLLEGEAPPISPILIAPGGVIQRESANALMTRDKHVNSAIEFIRAHLNEVTLLPQIFKHVPMSRRTLERRFHECLGYTIGEVIQLLKIERVQHLLHSTSMKLYEIAEASGFLSIPYMTKLFREKVGATPGEYRARFRHLIV